MVLGRHNLFLQNTVQFVKSSHIYWYSYFGLGHQLPGGNYYRELLLTLPGKGKPEFRDGHYINVPNVLAHIRFNERIDAEGNKVLFIEEIQSDWAQKGKKEGFNDPAAKDKLAEATKQYDTAIKEMKRINQAAQDTKNEGADFVSMLDRIDELNAEMKVLKEQIDVLRPASKPNIPNAPFVGTTDAWVALAVKRMVKYAADNGFAKIAWTTGQQQFDRYPDGTEDQKTARLAGMQAFYDTIVPKVFNKVLNKLGGGRVGSINVGQERAVTQSEIDTAERQGHFDEAERLTQIYERQELGRGDDSVQAETILTPQPAIDITPATRAATAAGVPQFSVKSSIEQITEHFTAEVNDAIAKNGNRPLITLADNTPASLQVFGWQDLPVVVRPGTDGVLKMMFDHGMTAAEIGTLIPETLRRPAMILQHRGLGGEEINFIARDEKRGLPIVLGIHPVSPVAGGKAAQLVATLLPKTQGWAYVATEIRRGNLLYRDTTASVIENVRGAMVDAQKKYAREPRSLLGLIPIRTVATGHRYKLLGQSDLVKWEADNWGDTPKFSAKSPITQAPIGQSWEATPLTNWDAFVRTQQNSLVDMHRVQWAIGESGIVINDDTNPHLLDGDGCALSARFVEVKKPHELVSEDQCDEISFMKGLGLQARVLLLSQSH